MSEENELLEWLRGKLADAEHSLKCREAMEARCTDGKMDEWKQAAALIGGKPPTRNELRRDAGVHQRIAAKFRREVAMFKEAINAIERMVKP